MEDAYVIKKSKVSGWFWVSLILFILTIFLSYAYDYSQRKLQAEQKYIRQLSNEINILQRKSPIY